jgi:hypothetical protein
VPQIPGYKGQKFAEEVPSVPFLYWKQLDVGKQEKVTGKFHRNESLPEGENGKLKVETRI